MNTLTRRTLTAALVFAPALLRAQSPRRLRPTPSQTEGPFYPVRLPADSDNDLLRNGSQQYAKGRPASLEGTVTDVDGRPLAGATVEIWQWLELPVGHHVPGPAVIEHPETTVYVGAGRTAVLDSIGNLSIDLTEARA